MDGKCITVTMVKMLGSDVKVNNMLLCNNSTKDQEGILLSCMHAVHLLTVLPLLYTDPVPEPIESPTTLPTSPTGTDQCHYAP